MGAWRVWLVRLIVRATNSLNAKTKETTAVVVDMLGKWVYLATSSVGEGRCGLTFATPGGIKGGDDGGREGGGRDLRCGSRLQPKGFRRALSH